MKEMEEIQFVKFSVEDAFRILGNLDDINSVRLNMVSGPGYSAFHNGELLGCGGIRQRGIGEAWAIYTEKAKEHKKELLKQSRIWLDRMMRDERIWRVWSETPKIEANQNFLKHLGFRELQAFLRG